MNTVRDMMLKYEDVQLTMGEKVSQWLNRHIVDMEGHIDDDRLADYVDSLINQTLDALAFYAEDSNWLEKAIADQGDIAKGAVCRS